MVVWRATSGHLGGLEGLLEARGGHLGSLEGYLGDLEGHLGAKKAAKGQNLDFATVFCMVFGPSLRTIGWVLEPSGGSGRPSWVIFGAILVVWRSTLAGLVGHLGGLEGLLEALGGPS